MKKIFFTCILFLGLAMTGFAQSDKMKEKANEKVEEMNAQIMAGDKSLSLTDNQKTEIYNIHIERLKELRKARKEGADKEKNKEINKKYFKKIYQDVLTKEQKKARKEGKESMSED